MSGPNRGRYGYIDMPRQLVEHTDPSLDLLRVAIGDALHEAGMTKDDRYYIRVAVIELPEGETP